MIIFMLNDSGIDTFIRFYMLLPMLIVIPDMDDRLSFNFHMDRKVDALGNPGMILRRDKPDDRYLILWDLSPGLNGGAQYKVEGNAKVISRGLTTQEEGSKRGQTDCPIVLISGACSLTW